MSVMAEREVASTMVASISYVMLAGVCVPSKMDSSWFDVSDRSEYVLPVAGQSRSTIPRSRVTVSRKMDGEVRTDQRGMCEMCNK